MLYSADLAAELSRYSCPECGGTGNTSHSIPGADLALCDCACRAVFRACYQRFQHCAAQDGWQRRVGYTALQGTDRRQHITWIRRNEDYIADFYCAAQRVLSAERFRVFRLHHILAGAAELVARQTGVSKSHMYRVIAEIETAVGREISSTEPHSLYPPRAYMAATIGGRTLNL